MKAINKPRNLKELVDSYIHVKDKRVIPMHLTYAGNDYAFHSVTDDEMVPKAILYIPFGFIKHYNYLLKSEKSSKELGNPDELWNNLQPHLYDQNLKHKNLKKFYETFDDLLDELANESKAVFTRSELNSGVLLDVRKNYNPENIIPEDDDDGKIIEPWDTKKPLRVI